jgi:amphi-Trp domain-containing protein
MKCEDRKKRREVGTFLQDLGAKLAEGKVILKQGGDEVELKIPKEIWFEFKAEAKAKKKGTKYSVEVELDWYEGSEEPECDISLG